MSSSSEDEVLFETVPSPSCHSNYCLITMNRPKALNSLNYNMIQLMTPKLREVEKDDNIHFVVVRGNGGKAFCAGGDIRTLTEVGKTDDPLVSNFFHGEYSLNYLIGTLKKPYIAIIDGITMGGGVGLSVHSPFRVATETTTFAMPETAIGLFPDVGGGYFLPRLKGELGMFLALTGHRLKGRDVQHAGVATHFISREKIPDLLSEFSKACDDPEIPTNSYDVIHTLLDRFHAESSGVDPREFSLSTYFDEINRCFSGNSVEEIFEKLRKTDSEWSKQLLDKLHKMSPTSMKVTHRQLKEGHHLSFAECFTMEYRLALRSMEGKDFYEGVRAVLVDKDNSPKWDPPTLEGVTKEMLDHYFSPLGEDQELYVA